MNIGVNQKTSPIKFCFLIKPNSKKRFEDALKTSFSIWGGMYSPILPVYKNMPRSYRKEYDIVIKTNLYYQNSVNNYDPDVVVYDDDLDIDYINSLVKDRKVIKKSELVDQLNKGKNSFGLSIIQILGSIHKTEFKFKRNDDLKLFLPTIEESSLFLKAFLGSPLDKVSEIINKELKGKHFFENSTINLKNLNDNFPNNHITHLELNSSKIRSYPERHWYRGVSIYFIDESRLNDIINFWNLRALGWNIIPIPIGDLKNSYFQELLERFADFQIRKGNGLTILGYLISFKTTVEQKKEIDIVLNKLIKQHKKGSFNFSFQGWFPRFWEERSVLEADKTLCEKSQIDYNYETVDFDENYVRFKIKPLPFEINRNSNSRFIYKVNLSFTYFDEYANNAGLVYGIESIDWIRLTHSYGRDKWKLSQNGLSYFVRRDDEDISFRIPKALDFFKIYFSKRDNKLIETSNGKLANQVLKNIGGINGSYFLKSIDALKIIDLFEGGKIITNSQLIGEIKKNLKIKKNDDAQYYLKNLIDNKIIEFGSKIQCTICFQRTFYLPNELKEKLTCSVCRNKFKLPSHNPNDIQWSYRGIGPFSKNNKVGGLMSVFLTLKLFNREFADTSGNISSLIGFELEKKGENLKEVDLTVLLQERNEDSIPPDLFLCECKTFKNFTSKDIERMIELGEEFPNSILTFSTLKEELYEEEKVELRKVVKHFRSGVGNRPVNPVLILTAKELLPVDFFSHFAEYEEQTKPYHRYNDWIGNLAEFTVEKHLGLKTWGEIRTDLWRKEMETRNKKNAPQHSI